MNGNLYQTSHDEGRINAQGQYEYNITDHNNDLRVAFRDSLGIAVPTQSIFYDPWGLSMKGMQITRNPLNFNRYQFLNRETQFETGYIDLMRRQFDPQTGRFVSTDPITDGQEHLSLYQYGWNNPVLKPDPNGDCPLCPAIPFLPEIGAGLAAAGEYIVGTAVGVAILATVEKNADKIARGIENLAASGAMGTEHQYANWAKALDPSKSNSNNDKTKTNNEKDKVKIKVDEKDKIDRNDLDSPKKDGNAPTFKKDGTPVEIHHDGQKAKGPFKEMHQKDHRVGDNFSKNHPKGQTPLTKEERKDFPSLAGRTTPSLGTVSSPDIWRKQRFE